MLYPDKARIRKNKNGDAPKKMFRDDLKPNTDAAQPSHLMSKAFRGHFYVKRSKIKRLGWEYLDIRLEWIPYQENELKSVGILHIPLFFGGYYAQSLFLPLRVHAYF